MLLLPSAAPAAPPITRVPVPIQPMGDQTRNAPGRKILKEGDLSKTQFRFRLNALTNDQLVDWKGERMTKLAFLAAAGRRIRAAHLQIQQQAAPHGKAELAAARSRFSAEEAAKLAARNNQARHAAQQRIAELLATVPGVPPAPAESVAPAKGGAGAGPLLAAATPGAGRDDDAPPACPRPRIAYAPPFAISPGSYVAVVGCGFGAETPEGGLTLKLQADKVDIPLVVSEWHDGWITASVPAGLAGLLDQGGLLVVRAPAGESEGWLIPFRAARELRALRSSEVPVERCAATADANYCNHQARLDPAYWGLLDKSGLGNPAAPFASAAGYHADDGSPEGDRGVDVYHLRLANGWSLAGFTFHFDAAPGTGTAAPPQDFEPGYAEQVLMVPWAISGQGSVVYYLDLFATGPRATNP